MAVNTGGKVRGVVAALNPASGPAGHTLQPQLAGNVNTSLPCQVVGGKGRGLFTVGLLPHRQCKQNEGKSGSSPLHAPKNLTFLYFCSIVGTAMVTLGALRRVQEKTCVGGRNERKQSSGFLYDLYLFLSIMT